MNLRQVRKKIKSVTNVKKITKAMQLVSAVKMKKAQTVALEGRPYQTKLEELFYRILPSIESSQSPLLSATSTESRELVILVSSNKGLAGAFNMNLFKVIMSNTDFKNTDFITMGKKGTVFASIMKSNILADFSSSTHSSDVAAVFDMVVKSFLEGKYSKVHLAYNKFISTLRNEPTKEMLLPFISSHKDTTSKDEDLEYLIEPDKRKLFEKLLINYLEEKIRSAILNSEASEHSARMIAMKNATDNASDVIYSLTLMRNKLRQQKITYELLDMVTATLSIEE